MNVLLCIDKDGDQTLFQYQFTTDPYQEPEEISFKVCPVLDPFDDYYNFTVKLVGDRFLQIIMMTTNRQAIYSGKGITEAIIREAAVLFNRIVISSRNTGIPGEYRTESADKVWKRLVKQGLTVLDKEKDRYIYTGYKLINRIDPGYEDYEHERMELVQRYIEMPIKEMTAIQPVWAENDEPERYEVMKVDYDLITEKANFSGLRTDNLFDYLSADHRYADTLHRWENEQAVTPGDLSIKDGKLTIPDGRHRTILSGFLGHSPVPFRVQKEFKDEIHRLLYPEKN